MLEVINLEPEQPSYPRCGCITRNKVQCEWPGTHKIGDLPMCTVHLRRELLALAKAGRLRIVTGD